MLYLTKLVIQAKAAIEQSKNMDELELVRVEFFGKRGHFTKQMMALRNLAPKARPEAGMIINQAKQTVKKALSERKTILERSALETQIATEIIDISLPGRRIANGGLHPISRTNARIEHFFCSLGFSIANGPEIEDNYHNFEALNIPAHHPVRADQDTFWFDNIRLLRTQTSAIQIRIMKTQQPPIRIIAPGRVYRNDYDKTHTPMFHQMEGMIVDTDISFTNLKSTLHDFLYSFFEEDLPVRFRPSYFPFTEPSAEVDIMGQSGCWLEVLGCGMIHPNVLQNVGIDPEIYSGFAFGIGIERLTMIRYGITDLREFFENDLRFLKQFK